MEKNHVRSEISGNLSLRKRIAFIKKKQQTRTKQISVEKIDRKSISKQKKSTDNDKSNRTVFTQLDS